MFLFRFVCIFVFFPLFSFAVEKNPYLDLEEDTLESVEAPKKEEKASDEFQEEKKHVSGYEKHLEIKSFTGSKYDLVKELYEKAYLPALMDYFINPYTPYVKERKWRQSCVVYQQTKNGDLEIPFYVSTYEMEIPGTGGWFTKAEVKKILSLSMHPENNSLIINPQEYSIQEVKRDLVYTGLMDTSKVKHRKRNLTNVTVLFRYRDSILPFMFKYFGSEIYGYCWTNP